MMKKLMYLGMMLVVALAMASCSSGGPGSALKDYVTAMKDGDYEKFVNGIDFSKTDPDKVEEARQGYVALLQEKGGKELEKKGGLKSIEVISEKIAEDGNSAVVTFKQVYGNGEESEDEQKMVKVDGKWLMDIGK